MASQRFRRSQEITAAQARVTVATRPANRADSDRVKRVAFSNLLEVNPSGSPKPSPCARIAPCERGSIEPGGINKRNGAETCDPSRLILPRSALPGLSRQAH